MELSRDLVGCWRVRGHGRTQQKAQPMTTLRGNDEHQECGCCDNVNATFLIRRGYGWQESFRTFHPELYAATRRSITDAARHWKRCREYAETCLTTTGAGVCNESRDVDSPVLGAIVTKSTHGDIHVDCTSSLAMSLVQITKRCRLHPCFRRLPRQHPRYHFAPGLRWQSELTSFGGRSQQNHDIGVTFQTVAGSHFQSVFPFGK